MSCACFERRTSLQAENFEKSESCCLPHVNYQHCACFPPVCHTQAFAQAYWPPPT